MAESLELQRANQTMKLLKLNTFGDNRITFLDVPITDMSKAVEMMKHDGRRKYKIKTDGFGAIEIEFEADDRFPIALYNNSRWATNLLVSAGAVKVENVATAQGMQVSTIQTKQNEARNVHATFKIEHRGLNMLKRLDVKD